MIGAHEFVSLSSEAAFAISEGLSILAWNRAAERLFGLAAAEAIGRRCCDVVSAELPSGEPLCGPDCHGAVCFGGGKPFGVDDCLIHGPGPAPVRVCLSSLVVPAAESAGMPATRALIFVHRLDERGAARPLPQPLHIRMLGTFSATLNERHVPAERWQRKAAVSVLKILAMRPESPVPRDRLIEHLWPGVDEMHGRDRLKVAVYSLRKMLGDAGLVEYRDGAYALRADAVLLDVAVFERLVARGTRHARQDRPDLAATDLGDALKLYRGDYLEEDIYQDWCAEERMRLRELYFEAAGCLAATLIGLRRHDEAGKVCIDALARENCREAFHQMRMECLLAEGREEEAERQYRRCCEALNRELAVEPLPETRRLAARIRAARAARG